MKKIILFFALVFLLSAFLKAQEIDMSGSVAYNQIGNKVNLSVGEIANLRQDYSVSGTLAIQLWATSAPYYGEPTLYGYKLAEWEIGEIYSGYYLDNLSSTVPFYAPPNGVYNVVIALAEWNGNSYVTIDWENFLDFEAFGVSKPTPLPSTPSSDAVADFIGTWEMTTKTYLNGEIIEGAGTSKIERFQKRGFISRARVKIPGKIVVEGVCLQYDSGAMTGTFNDSDGKLIGTISGTWNVNGRTITSQVTGNVNGLTYTQTIQNTITDKNTMASYSTTSYGATVTGSGKRVQAPPPAKSKQTIQSFSPIGTKAFGIAPFVVTAPTASSSLPVTLSVKSGPAMISANYTITLTGVGTVVLAANQVGNAGFNAAPEVTTSFTVNKGNQTLSFAEIPAKKFGDAPLQLSATAPSKLGVIYTSSNTKVATVSRNKVTIVGVGSAVITASQGGDSKWNAAAPLKRNLLVSKGDQQITFPKPADRTFVKNSKFTITASVTSNLPVTFSSSNPSIISITGNTATVLAKGKVTITATQRGNDNYNKANTVGREIILK
jgi:hypothetical protein